jgi:hypothetical protein
MIDPPARGRSYPYREQPGKLPLASPSPARAATGSADGCWCSGPGRGWGCGRSRAQIAAQICHTGELWTCANEDRLGGVAVAGAY